MSKKKKEKPIYEYDKYGMLYRVNPELSERDKNLLKQIQQSLTLKNKNV